MLYFLISLTYALVSPNCISISFVFSVCLRLSCLVFAMVERVDAHLFASVWVIQCGLQGLNIGLCVCSLAILLLIYSIHYCFCTERFSFIFLLLLRVPKSEVKMLCAKDNNALWTFFYRVGWMLATGLLCLLTFLLTVWPFYMLLVFNDFWAEFCVFLLLLQKYL